jgi:hypothetical protein
MRNDDRRGSITFNLQQENDDWFGVDWLWRFWQEYCYLRGLAAAEGPAHRTESSGWVHYSFPLALTPSQSPI